MGVYAFRWRGPGMLMDCSRYNCRPGRGAGRTEGADWLCLVAARRYPARVARCRLPVGLDHRAVCPARDTGVALVMTQLDTAAMNLFLAELGQAVAPGAHGIVLMDKVGWHTAGDLVVPENLSVVFLPPYSRLADHDSGRGPTGNISANAILASAFAASAASSLCFPPPSGFVGLRLQLDIFPRIGIPCALVTGEHILPVRRLDAGADRVHEGVTEHRHEIIILQDRALDLLGQRLTFGGLIGSEVLLVFDVELLDAELVGGEHAAAFELRFVPIGPAGADASAGQEDVDAGPFLHPALLAFLVNCPLQCLHLAADAEGL